MPENTKSHCNTEVGGGGGGMEEGRIHKSSASSSHHRSQDGTCPQYSRSKSEGPVLASVAIQYKGKLR